MKKTFRYIALVLLLATSCKGIEGTTPAQKESAKEEFSNRDTISIVLEGKPTKIFNEDSDQVSYTENRSVFMVTNQDYTDNYTLMVTGEIAVGEEVLVDCSSTSDDTLDGLKYTTEVIKISEDGTMFWLWDSSSESGFVLDFD